MSNFISSASDRKRRKTKLNNCTIQHNETKSIEKLSYIQLNPYQIASISTLQQIEQASNVIQSIRTTEKA